MTATERVLKFISRFENHPVWDIEDELMDLCREIEKAAYERSVGIAGAFLIHTPKDPLSTVRQIMRAIGDQVS